VNETAPAICNKSEKSGFLDAHFYAQDSGFSASICISTDHIGRDILITHAVLYRNVNFSKYLSKLFKKLRPGGSRRRASNFSSPTCKSSPGLSMLAEAPSA